MVRASFRAKRAPLAAVLLIVIGFGAASSVRPTVASAAQPSGCGGYVKQSNGPHGAFAYLGGYVSSCGYIQWFYTTHNSNGPVSSMSQHDRAWVCGRIQHDVVLNHNGGNDLSDSSSNYYYGSCGPQADISSSQSVTGQWSWWTYLSF